MNIEETDPLFDINSNIINKAKVVVLEFSALSNKVLTSYLLYKFSKCL